MLPTINGKKVSEWSFSDLQDILDNEDFRESDYLDYKKSFEYFDIPKNNTSQRNEAKAELRKDICAFANAQGGYLIFGIKEDGKGVSHTISGIVLENGNKDTFESSIKNILQTINPRMPLIKFHYIDTSDSERFVVILEIVSDQYAPYDDLKGNYSGTLDEKDIEEAFKHDDAIKTAKCQYKSFRIKISIFWIVTVIALGVFTGVTANLHNKTRSTLNSNTVVEESADNGVTPSE